MTCIASLVKRRRNTCGVVARDLTDIGNGCMGTVYRVRQVGVGAAFDSFCDEAAIRHYWPHQAESALQRFDYFDPQPMQ